MKAFQKTIKNKKKRAICCRSMPGHLACQISGSCIYFWQTYSPKTASVDDVIFQTAILSISGHRPEINMTFLESWDQTGSKTHILFSKNQLKNLTLCDPGLTRPFSVVDLHGVRLQNGLEFWILRAKVTINHVSHARKRVFDSGDVSWPFVTWPWPWPVLSMALMLTGYLH